MIPKIVHFCYFWPEDNLPLYVYLAVASAKQCIQPEQIKFYIANGAPEPAGVWWQKIRELVTIVRVDPPDQIFGNPLAHVAHQSDVLRLQVLISDGGIYLDTDTICCKSFDNLLHEKCVLGLQGCGHSVGLGNAVILAEPNSEFLRLWLQEYKTFASKGRDDQWDYHSVQLPLILANQSGTSANGLLRILSEE